MNLNTYPYPVLKLAAKTQRLSYSQTQSWASLQQLPKEYTSNIIYQQAASAIAREFVKHVHEHMMIQNRDTALGRVTEFEAVALSYTELVELLYHAYVEGETTGMKRTNTLNFMSEIKK
jgi:hypothetical protein